MRILLCVIVVVLSVLIVGDIYSQEEAGERDPAYRDRFGAKVGYITGGITYENTSYDLKSKFDFGMFIDFRIMGNILLSPSIDIIGIEPDVRGVSEGRSMLHPGASVKYIFTNEKRSFAFRPGVGVGYGLLSKYYALKESQYLTVSVFGELVLYINGKSGFLMELNYFTASGGDDTYDIESDGIMIFRAGFLF